MLTLWMWLKGYWSLGVCAKCGTPLQDYHISGYLYCPKCKEVS